MKGLKGIVVENGACSLYIMKGPPVNLRNQGFIFLVDVIFKVYKMRPLVYKMGALLYITLSSSCFHVVCLGDFHLSQDLASLGGRWRGHGVTGHSAGVAARAGARRFGFSAA